jgi:hypothetical protein
MLLTPSKRLLAAIRELPSRVPISQKWPTPPSSVSHKEHWTGWLAEYDGPGYYGRRVTRVPRSMAYIYGHIHCTPMLLWLAEASGVDGGLVLRADRELRAQVRDGLSASSPGAARHFRERIGWPLIETALTRRRLLAA